MPLPGAQRILDRLDEMENNLTRRLAKVETTMARVETTMARIEVMAGKVRFARVYICAVCSSADRALAWTDA